jgi:small neutral amino acid transporter SnatA (MarC family)
VTRPELLILAAIGLFSMAGGLFDWNWFMTSRRAWIFVKLLGRTGARAFYVLLGLALIILGILLAYDVI